MLTISNQANGYKIKISHPGTGTRGFSVFARNVREMHEAIDHYFAKKQHDYFTSIHCPLCRLQLKEKRR